MPAASLQTGRYMLETFFIFLAVLIVPVTLYFLSLLFLVLKDETMSILVVREPVLLIRTYSPNWYKHQYRFLIFYTSALALLNAKVYDHILKDKMSALSRAVRDAMPKMRLRSLRTDILLGINCFVFRFLSKKFQHLTRFQQVCSTKLTITPWITFELYSVTLPKSLFVWMVPPISSRKICPVLLISCYCHGS